MLIDRRMTEFSQITFIRACTGFVSAIPTGLPDYHPTMVMVGEKGCVAIVRDEAGGFDVYGEGNQHFWVSGNNVVWGRKLERSRPTDAPVTKVEPTKDPVELPVLPEIFESTKSDLTPYIEGPTVRVQPEPKKRGRPKK